MKQKLAIACGLLHRPSALLLDEPLTGLDPVGIRRMKATISRRAAGGAAVILSSHLLHLVEEICTRLLILHRGRSVASGTVQEIVTERPDLAGRTLEDVFLALVGQEHGAHDRGLRVSGLAFAYNRFASQLRRLRSPRYLVALLVGLTYVWFVAVEQLHASTGVRGFGRPLGRVVRSAGCCGGRGMGLGLRRGAASTCLQPGRSQFPLPRPGHAAPADPIQIAAHQLLIFLNAMLWTLLLSRERLGASPWLRVLSFWVLLTTLSFHRLGASFVRTTLLEHGRFGLKHRAGVTPDARRRPPGRRLEPAGCCRV